MQADYYRRKNNMESKVESKIIGTETIECPECGSHENAQIEGDVFFASYLHECKNCGYLIMESEWQPVETLEGKAP